jgi:putative ABC transport system permease protein
VRLLLLLREALATAWASKVPSALITVFVATMCAATLATVGRTAAAENLLTQRLDSAGSRVLTVSDTRQAGLVTPTVIDQVARLSTTERAIGTLTATDLVNGVLGPGGTKVPAWGVVGDLTAAAVLTEGRWPGPGEALVSAPARDALGLDAPYGWVAPAAEPDVADYAIVGTFEPRPPFEDYGTGILYLPGTAPTGTDLAASAADVLHVVLTDARQARAAQADVLAIVAPPTFDAITITSPVSLAELQGQVTGDLSTFSRTLLLATIGGGALLVAIVTLADVLIRRADLGRRRALGATRGTIVALVTLRTLAPALAGVLLGSGIGTWLAQRAQALPPLDFTLATATLALVCAVASAIPPAVFAASRDPVRVLRTA